MKDDGISTEVKDFISSYIDSIEGLEVILLLSGQPDQYWSAANISQSLRTDDNSVATRLEQFSRFGLIEETGQNPKLYRLKPHLALKQTIDGLAQAYNERRVRVIDLIFSKPIDKIRIFSDAFKLRKD